MVVLVRLHGARDRVTHVLDAAAADHVYT